MRRAFYALGIAAFVVSLATNLAAPLISGTITKPNTFTSGTSISSSQVNANFDTAYNEINGLLDSANIENETLTTDDILNSTLTGSDIQDNSIAGADIQQLTVTGGAGGDIASGTITGANIATSNITRDHLASEEVLSEAIRNFTIVGGNGGDIASGTITGGNIATDNVTEDHLAAGSVASSELLDGGILVGDVRPGTLTGGNGGSLASGTITGANIATSNVTVDHLGSSAVTYPKINALIDTLPYSYANLVCDVGTTTTNATITADWVTLQNPDDSTWIVVKSVSLTCTPVSGAAALNAQATSFTAAAQPYFLWIGAKSDGTAARVCLSQNSAIATVQNEFVAIDATYTYVGLYGAVANTAAGSYTLREQLQIGSKVAYRQRVLDSTVSSDVTGQFLTISDHFPYAISTLVDLYLHVEDDGTSSTDATLFGGDTGNTLFVVKALGDQDVVVPDYPTSGGHVVWTLDVNGSGNASIYVQGYKISHLAR